MSTATIVSLTCFLRIEYYGLISIKIGHIGIVNLQCSPIHEYLVEV